MSETKRKNFSGEFKAKVALEAVRGIKTVNEIGQEFGVHPTQVGMWKKELQEQASSLFDSKRGNANWRELTAPRSMRRTWPKNRMFLGTMPECIQMVMHLARRTI
ncbi:hypothetical protein NSMM_540035 [Nitrosomonas mobilis]|uniref:Transposase n=1 Tax=Nitrosomonas mobilis TaxID=51642 RepID=A0A1G5SH60_9PROT|nr:hypothetical protein NSMM_540035 [Nitrosomonas mobilis]